MREKLLLRYIIKVWNLNNFRGSSKWRYYHIADKSYGLQSPDIGFSMSHVQGSELLKEWIDNPAAAMEYLNKHHTQTRRIYIQLARHFLEHGI